MSINLCHDFRYGKIMYNNLDMYIGKSLKLYGEFSQGEAELFDKLIKPGNIVVEAGANIGSHTIHLSQLVGKTGKVYAFEPQRLIFQLLAGNMALNSIENVYCIQACVSDKEGSVLVPFLDPSKANNFGGLSLKNTTFGEKCTVTTIDKLELQGCDFLKIDVEGMELNVLRGAENTIKTYRPIIYAEADRENKKEDLFSYIKSIDYRIYYHKPLLYNPDNYFKNTENVFQNTGSINIICIPKESQINLEQFKEV